MSGTGHRVADHLMDRLAELGVDRIFGVPGDYTLALLDHVVAHDRIAWTGCTNELNAGYAADGYGRLRGVAALLTTFGVGELSAINALAGAYAEHVPVVHVVGAPSSDAQAAQRMVHHSLGDGIFTQFAAMHAEITCARASLTAENARAEIDRVLTAVRDEHQPGYLLLPADVAELPVEPATEPLPPRAERTDPDVLEAFVDAARRLLERAGSVSEVSVLAGLLVHRFGAGERLAELLAAGPLRHATSPWSKSLVDESAPHFAGTYVGGVSAESTRAAVEDAAALVVAGVQFTDLTSGFFTQQITRARTVELGAHTASVGAATFAPLELPDALAALVPLVTELATRSAPVPPQASAPARPAPAAGETPLSQDLLWDALAGCLTEGNVVVADQGTSFYGMATHRLPRGVTFIGQPLWASIGYTLPAMLGACLAEPERRGVLLIGDGAAQMTATELSTILHAGLCPLVLVVDNDGYTVERAIHGPDEAYNDIAPWDWTLAPGFFGAGHLATTRRVTTVGELRDALDAVARAPEQAAVIQAVVPRMDVPELLGTLTRSLG